jgi:8-oxo-dGTP pyrophosphatase MutT (NUDIX family)
MNIIDMAKDGEEFEHHSHLSGGQDWIASWHPASLPPPEGKNHGAGGVCFTPEGNVIVVSENDWAWTLPAGRPEPGETLYEILVREVLEEACATVERATLLGYAKGVCIRGREEGLVLIRSFWCAAVTVHAWQPQFEMVNRLILPPEEALARISVPGYEAIFRRLFHEALLVQRL